MKDTESEANKEQNENRFLLMGFMEFTILSTLIVVFFPFSLLFCVVFWGLSDTSLLIAALLHDFLKTLGAIVIGILIVITFIAILFT